MPKKKKAPFQELIDFIITFRDERDWKQFHKPKDSAIALNLEASEVLEHFLWKNDKEITKHIKKRKKEIGDELADVLFWVLLMSHDLKIDLVDAFYKKREEDAKKYPVEKVKGKNKKYTEY